MESLKCMRCGKGFGKLRGLCLTCYGLLRDEVAAGRATWQQYEQAGKCKAAKRSLGLARDVIMRKEQR